MLEPHTINDIEKTIRDNKYPCFKLFVKAAASYDHFKLIKTHVPEVLANVTDKEPTAEQDGKETKNKKKIIITNEMINETVAVLHNNLMIYQDKPGYLFQVELRTSGGATIIYGPFIFTLTANPYQNSQGLNGTQIPDFRSSDDYIDFRIAKANHDRDVREFYIKKAELEEQSKEFETKKINPAAQVAAKGALYAWDVFSKNVLKIDSSLSGIPVKDDEKPTDSTNGTEDEDTEAASKFANDLISSGLSADQIKELHRIAKENLIPKMKTNGNKDQETD
jgi:hypothetical protein